MGGYVRRVRGGGRWGCPGHPESFWEWFYSKISVGVISRTMVLEPLRKTKMPQGVWPANLDLAGEAVRNTPEIFQYCN